MYICIPRMKQHRLGAPDCLQPEVDFGVKQSRQASRTRYTKKEICRLTRSLFSDMVSAMLKAC